MLTLAKELTVKRRAALSPSTVPAFKTVFQIKGHTNFPGQTWSCESHMKGIYPAPLNKGHKKKDLKAHSLPQYVLELF